jgi:ketosteroid isomerase-like protein
VAGYGTKTGPCIANEVAETTGKQKCVMRASENNKLMQHIFSELSIGNSRPFAESMADDFSWTITGTTQWSKRYEGKRAVADELFGALRTKLVPPIVVEAHRFIADEDYVVVEARGRNTTKDGVPYNNTYCYVFRLADGKLQEMTEYLDTELVTAALGDPVTKSSTNTVLL